MGVECGVRLRGDAAVSLGVLTDWPAPVGGLEASGLTLAAVGGSAFFGCAGVRAEEEDDDADCDADAAPSLAASASFAAVAAAAFDRCRLICFRCFCTCLCASMCATSSTSNNSMNCSFMMI